MMYEIQLMSWNKNHCETKNYIMAETKSELSLMASVHYNLLPEKLYNA